ncbi:LPS assembly lipoprotein LptE [Thalassovita sp.]|uniref:LPS assembly lipoprotein LptE n=1 Tax=Thalassovita sp. TaxID=1979401 RepID=UPI0029DE8DDE|nr:LPS assembly lipoprotein LptE [Thalassovita sp.]
MWLSKRKALLIIAAAALAGCGFAPAYGPQGAANGLLDSVTVDAPENRNEQWLVQRLESRLGRTDGGRYQLGYQMTYSSKRMAVTKDNTTSRFNIVGVVDYALRDGETGVVLTKGKVTSFTGYSTTSSTVATLASERDARERLAMILADQIVTRLTAAAPGLAK